MKQAIECLLIIICAFSQLATNSTLSWRHWWELFASCRCIQIRPLTRALMYLPGKEPGLQGRACRVQGCTSQDRQRRAQKGQRQLRVAKASKSNTRHETEQACLSFTTSQSLLKLLSLESMMPSNHLSLCHSLLLLPSIFPRGEAKDSALLSSRDASPPA